MSITRINRELGLLVWLRADSRCEYCGMPQQFDDLTFEIDHVVAEQHGGKTSPANLALACFSCNRRKGSNLGGIDPETLAIRARPARANCPTTHSCDAHPGAANALVPRVAK